MDILIVRRDTETSVRKGPDLSSLPFLPLSSECNETINTFTGPAPRAAAGIFIYTSSVC